MPLKDAPDERLPLPRRPAEVQIHDEVAREVRLPSGDEVGDVADERPEAQLRPQRPGDVRVEVWDVDVLWAPPCVSVQRWDMATESRRVGAGV